MNASVGNGLASACARSLEKPKTRVILRMPQDEDNALAASTKPIETVADHLSADSSALLFRHHGHWRQCHSRNGNRSRLNQHPTKEDMSDDPFVVLRDKRG